MRSGYSLFFLCFLVAAAILMAGCTQTSQPAAVTATPTATETATAVQTTIAACGIENCHGFTVQCGPNIVSSCTNDIDPGDRCRKYAECQVVSGTCQLVTDTKYDKCVSCVKLCQSTYYNDPNMLIDCSDRCV